MKNLEEKPEEFSSYNYTLSALESKRTLMFQNQKIKAILIVILVASAIGLADASYLTYEHYAGGVVPCSLTDGCETVLTSEYATVGELPISLFGIGFYVSVFILGLALFKTVNKRPIVNIILALTSLAFLSSLGLAYLQFFVIESICMYCMLSALVSTTLFVSSIFLHKFNNLDASS